MNDLEMTKLCAQAMGYKMAVSANDVTGEIVSVYGSREVFGKYDPLHDDAQAMALVKQFGLTLTAPIIPAAPTWEAYPGGELSSVVENADLNRAIVECVAQMQAAKP